MVLEMNGLVLFACLTFSWEAIIFSNTIGVTSPEAVSLNQTMLLLMVATAAIAALTYGSK
jgi:hypothetical protein